MRIKPPRDMQAWRNLPVSAVANFKPVVIHDFAADHLTTLLDQHPYRCFPVATAGRLEGIVTRVAVEAALHHRSSPTLEAAVTCRPEQTIREVADRFLNTPSGFQVVVDPQTATTRGVLTLHDLLRAQAALTE